VVPEFRLREIENFITEDAVDFSISRLASKMPWGIPVPGDEAHVMYVWFDALINYISVLGWPDDLDTFQDAWPGVQIAGKDNLRQQSAMWQAMLASVGLPHSSQIIIHGFITSNGQKMSKSLGNVVDPFDQVEKFGTDAVRYYLIAEIPTFDDGDYSETRFVELYNADLANGIGNHTSRILKLAEGMKYVPTAADATLYEAVDKHMRAYESGSAIMALRTQLSQYSKALDADHPWTIKETHLKQEILITHLRNLYQFAYNLQIFLPDTANQILDALSAPSITAPKPLFARI
jgi:methionyl-tRNA synthetase